MSSNNVPQLEFKSIIKRFLATSIIAILVVGFMFAISLILSSYYFNISIDETLTASAHISNDTEIAITKILLATQTISLFGIVPLIFLISYKKKETISFLKISSKNHIKYIPLVIIIMITSLPFINFIAEFNGLIIDTILGPDNFLKTLQKENINISQKLLQTDSLLIVFYNVLIVAVLPGFFEEFCFRGAMQNSIVSRIKSHHVAIISTGILFGLLHFEFYGVISRAMMGILFGYFLYWTNNLWFPIIAHFSNNAAIVIINYFIEKETLDSSVENIGGTNETMIIGLISGIVAAILIFILYNLIQKKNEEQIITIQ